MDYLNPAAIIPTQAHGSPARSTPSHDALPNAALPHQASTHHASSLVRASEIGRDAINAAVRTGAVQPVRRDLHVAHRPTAPEWERRMAVHEAVTQAVKMDGLAGVAVLETAAILHGVRTWSTRGSVHLSVAYRPHGLNRTPTRRDPTRPTSHQLGPADHRRALSSRAIIRHRLAVRRSVAVIIDGLVCSSLERTILDCARFLEPDAGLVVVDSLMAIATGAVPPRSGLAPSGGATSGLASSAVVPARAATQRALDRPWDRAAEIDSTAEALRERLLRRLEEHAGQRGYRRAQAVILAASPWSQSAYEAELRRLCLAHGFARPTPQAPIRTSSTTYFLDLGWPVLWRGAEIDGEVKSQADPGGEARHREARDAELSQAGLRVEHFTTAEVRDTERALEKLRDLLPRTAWEDRPVTELRTRRERPARRR